MRFKTRVYPALTEGGEYSIGLQIGWVDENVVVEHVDGPAGSAQPPIATGDTLVCVNTVRVTGLQKATDTIQRLCSRARAGSSTSTVPGESPK